MRERLIYFFDDLSRPCPVWVCLFCCPVLYETYPGEIKWNFAGIFIFSKEGEPLGRFAAQDLAKIEKALEAAVDQ